MGLSTTLYFLEPVDKHEVFSLANSLMGNIDPDVIEYTASEENDLVTLTNQPSRILPAWVIAKFRNHLPLYAFDYYEDGTLISPECWGTLEFRTNWDYSDLSGGPLELHARLLNGINQWAQNNMVKVNWRYHDDMNPIPANEGLEDFFTWGDRKIAWFNNEVLPKYEAMFSRP